ncbi:hypothetical protein [Roseibium aggregatum]|uniref:Uncharacterized protein n=1 Tax=Roseibium aggregatum TaxID=187304 RepID=A0A926S9J0_9HYPH|nr:hypothetical protein [Roseibium aggregatum]MBD1547044.1 hypothetical protein [Roseibium aggregatum]
MIRKEGKPMENLPKFMRMTAACLVLSAAFAAAPSAGFAQTAMPDGNAAEGAQLADDQSPTDQRYGLVEANGDILRIDRQAGSVSFCRKINGAWRCMPAPLAEEAYQNEIADLSQEVDRLKARIRDLEAQVSARPEETAPQVGAEPAEPPHTAQDKAAEPPKASEDQTAEDKTPPADKDKSASRLSDEDEQQLERMMQFSEKAMRRFFGLMKDLQTEFGSN